jgi:macrolide-specific efflux system membrane fusion protein
MGFRQQELTMNAIRPAVTRVSGFLQSTYARLARRGTWWVIAAAVSGVAVLAFVIWWFVGSGTTSEVLLVPVVRADVEDSVTALGNLQPRNYVDVGAQVSGVLKKLLVEIGATVKAGQLVAEIDPAVLNTKVDAGRAQLRNLKAAMDDKVAQLALARGQYARQAQLKRANATSEDAYQIALSTMSSADATLKAARAQIDQTASTLHGDEVTLGYTKIYAPIAGTVVSITTKQGQTINANQQAPVILRIADLTTMTVWTQVSEADVPKLVTGMDAYFTILGSPRKRWKGKLRQVLPTPEVVNNVVLYTALFEVDNKDRDLMTQMTAQVFFVISGKSDVLSVPVSSLRSSKPAEHLFKVTVVDDTGKQTEREIKVGVTNRVSAEVISGLVEGDQVVAGSKSTATATSARSGALSNAGRGGGGGGFGGHP